MPVRRGGVHFLHVDMARFGDGDAGLADAARLDGRLAALAVRADAVERAGDDARRGGLAHAAHAGQHEGMGDAPGGKGVGQRPDQRFLADQPGEIGGAVFARQHAIGRALRRALGRLKAEGWFVAHRTKNWVAGLLQGGRRRRAAFEPMFGGGGTAGTTRSNRYGCFLPDLTGLARTASANLPGGI